MPPKLAQALAPWSRNLRLLRRHLRYGRASWQGSASPAKSAELAALFRTVNTHLRQLSIDYFLTYGTLLGWYRHRKPLPHDGDVDFAAPVAAYPLVWASRSQLPAGYTMHDTSHRHPGPKLYIEHRGWEADIYFLQEADGRLRTLLNSPFPPDRLPYPREWFYPPQATEFLGEPTFVPAQSQAYLEFIYRYLGPDAERDPRTGYFRPRPT